MNGAWPRWGFPVVFTGARPSVFRAKPKKNKKNYPEFWDQPEGRDVTRGAGRSGSQLSVFGAKFGRRETVECVACGGAGVPEGYSDGGAGCGHTIRRAVTTRSSSEDIDGNRQLKKAGVVTFPTTTAENPRG